MLIFSKAKLVLFSVPKTGTTAIETALAPHAAIALLDPPELKHAPVYRYNRFLRPMVEIYRRRGRDTRRHTRARQLAWQLVSLSSAPLPVRPPRLNGRAEL